MKHIQVHNWRVGDILPTTSMSLFGGITRRRTWPGRSPFDMGLSTHTAVVVDRGGGLLYACEMTPKGIAMTELTKYDHPYGSWLDHPCALYRHPLFHDGGDGMDRRDKLNDYCIRLHSFHVRYGYEDLLRFIWPSLPDDPYAMVCSQFVVSALNQVDIPLPDGWFVRPKDIADSIVDGHPGHPGLVSPADIQRWCLSTCESVKDAVN